MSDHSPQDELAGTEQPFVQHLMELRDRMVKALLAVLVAAALLFFFPGPGTLYDWLAAPLVAHLPKGATLIATSVISPFMVPLKILLMAAFLLALPLVLWQVWAFVAPGLYSHEKKLVLPLVISSTILFFIGVAFCYFFVFGQVFAFIQGFAPKSITAAPDIEAYLSFVLTMFLAFGLSFEVPIAVVVLARMGVVSVEKLREFRGYFIVLAFVIAAIVTPPDVVSQLALAIPMCLLYELGIWAAQIFIQHTQAPSESDDTPAASS
ncbi:MULTISPECIES: twin-arginine translocase subunit TatC [Giesbergeria]|uniref:Sec-independent protein translocase protein TatC n=1 Tax=Giesbergeria sinuosa TaxID=80883 RepID=A0ABV9QEF3_9BURK